MMVINKDVLRAGSFTIIVIFKAIENWTIQRSVLNILVVCLTAIPTIATSTMHDNQDAVCTTAYLAAKVNYGSNFFVT